MKNVFTFVAFITFLVLSTNNLTASCANAYFSNEQCDEPFAMEVSLFMKKDKELWAALVGYEGRYKVSSFGRIKNVKSKKIKSPSKNRGGYNIVCIYGHKNVSVKILHRLIAKTFIPNPENKKEVNHKNGIKTDNRVVNLEWCTPKENTAHAWNNGLAKAKSGYNHFNIKITPVKLKKIQFLISKKLLLREISAETGFCISQISRIKRGIHFTNQIKKEIL